MPLMSTAAASAAASSSAKAVTDVVANDRVFVPVLRTIPDIKNKIKRLRQEINDLHSSEVMSPGLGAELRERMDASRKAALEEAENNYRNYRESLMPV
jgi:CRISPR/Cas system-associated protein Csm6